MVFKINFGLVVFFAVMALVIMLTKSAHFDNNLWPVKSCLLFALIIIGFFMNDDFFAVYVPFVTVLSGTVVFQIR